MASTATNQAQEGLDGVQAGRVHKGRGGQQGRGSSQMQGRLLYKKRQWAVLRGPHAEDEKAEADALLPCWQRPQVALHQPLDWNQVSWHLPHSFCWAQPASPGGVTSVQPAVMEALELAVAEAVVPPLLPPLQRPQVLAQKSPEVIQG